VADLTKLFHAHQVYVDEDGYLSFNPKYIKSIGIVSKTNMQLDQDYMDVSSFQDEQPQYVTVMQSYIVQYEIRVTANILDSLENHKESKKPKKPKPKIKKDIVEGPFAFLNIKED